MSLYKAHIEKKGYTLRERRFRWQRFAKYAYLYFATTLNLTNIISRCHKSMPVDDEDEYIVVSPYTEDYYNKRFHKNGYVPHKKNSKKVLACKVMR